ncbi:hypothetical protein SXCC_00664 [Gluconacetobacter sp. SXCC-1]|uniref:Uncharacterized protein n=8 Tax=Acetobacteraceae TaxID=433 RepID=A0A858JKQ8_9PROT|nr:hypothetical protein SXCC_00664 [Gluconacetobacter sp. SXCC-1]NPC90120.1 hypothetical protein [Gluconacetobacter entanii]PYD59440.1 hypothetical protein CFR73_11590 [Novacetimonas maltaceti]PYD69271.1 hypothetical protein CFR76_10460 [Komagataeibacter swingsii]PYD77885.1 hypothetical protein CFR77_13535 [Komagataeibacter sucrofermentans]QIP36610.1 hypothetical protein GWK63_15100 [Komagataeibacter rhaeticus]RBM06514.1 hypothetical protein NJLHNGOC_09425 [Novacetimonas cocois]RFO99581.1 hy
MKLNSHQVALAAIRKQTLANTKSKRTAHAALLRMGIIDSKGAVTKEYTRDPRIEGMLKA